MINGSKISAGMVLCDRFEIIQQLGAGGMGEVFEVLDRETGEHQAIKSLRRTLAENEAEISRFRQEVLKTRGLRGNHVCAVYDYHHDKKINVPFYNMELLRGETMAAFLSRRGRLPPKESRPLVEQLVEGLALAHGKNIIHRDLKDDNVFLVDEGGERRVVITDFGIARDLEADKQTKPGYFRGTWQIAAPEQFHGEVSPASDIFALGILVFQMLTGRFPYDLGDVARNRQQKSTGEWLDLKSIVPDLGSVWVQLIERCLSPEPGARFQAVEDVTAVLVEAPGPGVGSGAVGSLEVGSMGSTALVDPAALVGSAMPRKAANPARSPGVGTSSTVDRKQVAILVTDIKGYSSLMKKDNRRALEITDAHDQVVHGTLQDPAWRWIKSTGDGCLIELPNIIDAVFCALEAQRAFARRNSEVDKDRRFEVRMGIETGLVRIKPDGDVQGDPPNFAARLEGKCPSGAVCLRKKHFGVLRGMVQARAQELGWQRLKNMGWHQLVSLEPANAELDILEPLPWLQRLRVPAGAVAALAIFIGVFLTWPTLEGSLFPSRPATVLGFEPERYTTPHEWATALLPELLHASHPEIFLEREAESDPMDDAARFRVFYDADASGTVELRWEGLDGVAEGSVVGEIGELPGLVARLGRELSGRRAHRGRGLAPPTGADVETLRGMREHLRSGETVLILQESFPDLPSWPVEERAERLLDVLPDHPLIHTAAAQALFDLGYESVARQVMRAVTDGAGKLERDVQACFLAQLFATRFEWESAVALDQARWRGSGCPGLDTTELGLRLATGLARIGRSEEADEVLRELPSDPRITRLQAMRHVWVSDAERAIEVARRAVSEAPRDSSLEARARLRLGQAYRMAAEQDTSNRYEDFLASSRDELGKAIQIHAKEGHLQGAGAAWAELGIVQDLGGESDQAAESLGQAQQIFEDLPNPRSAAMVLQSLGLVKFLTYGDLTGAAQTFAEAARAAQQAGDARSELNALFNWIGIENDRGRLGQSAQGCRRADALSSREPTEIPLIEQVCGRFERLRGALLESRKRLEHGVDVARKLGQSERVFWVTQELLDTLLVLGEVDSARDLLEPLLDQVSEDFLLARAKRQLGILQSAAGERGAAESLREALKTELEWEDEESAALTRLALATDLLGRVEAGDARGLLTEADELARLAFETFEAYGYPLDAWRAQQVRVQIALQRGVSEARQRLEATRAWLGEVELSGLEIPELTLRFDLLSERVHLADTKPQTQVRQRLEELLAQAVAMRWRPLAFEASLTLAQLELGEGRSAKARQRLESLTKEAADAGFGRAEQKARHLLDQAERSLLDSRDATS